MQRDCYFRNWGASWCNPKACEFYEECKRFCASEKGKHSFPQSADKVLKTQGVKCK